MRSLSILIISALLAFSCVKPETKNPIPEIEFKSLIDPHKSTFTKGDTATMMLGYADGDGDLFVDNNSEGPNVIFTTYVYNTTTKQFVAPYDLVIKDTVRYVNTVKQPDNGYYKGKSIRGDIYLPLGQFRPSDKAKIIKFTGFVIDMKRNKSNIFSSPVYTLNF